MNAKIIGSRLRKRREEMRLTQRQLAKKLGIKASHVAYIEGGHRNPSIPLARRIEKTMGLPRGSLVLSGVARDLQLEDKDLAGDLATLGANGLPKRLGTDARRELRDRKGMVIQLEEITKIAQRLTRIVAIWAK